MGTRRVVKAKADFGWWIVLQIACGEVGSAQVASRFWLRQSSRLVVREQRGEFQCYVSGAKDMPRLSFGKLPHERR
jgi:hypothetical protein